MGNLYMEATQINYRDDDNTDIHDIDKAVKRIFRTIKELDPADVLGDIEELQEDMAGVKNSIDNLATVATSGSYDDLSDKPTIPAAQVPSDWNASSGVSQILNKPNLAEVATSGSYNDLSDKPTIPAAQVPSDWNASSGVAQILNKPTIPAAQIPSDWNASSGVSRILNKPNLASVATSGSYNDLSDKPTIPPDLSSQVSANAANISGLQAAWDLAPQTASVSIAAATGFTIDRASCKSWGKVAMLTFRVEGSVGQYLGQTISIGTLTGKRPVIAAYAPTDTIGVSATIGTSGAISLNVASNAVLGARINVTFVYLTS